MPGSLECVRILIQSGADKNIPPGDQKTIFDLPNEEDFELKEQLNQVLLTNNTNVQHGPFMQVGVLRLEHEK